MDEISNQLKHPQPLATMLNALSIDPGPDIQLSLSLKTPTTMMLDLNQLPQEAYAPTKDPVPKYPCILKPIIELPHIINKPFMSPCTSEQSKIQLTEYLDPQQPKLIPNGWEPHQLDISKKGTQVSSEYFIEYPPEKMQHHQKYPETEAQEKNDILPTKPPPEEKENYLRKSNGGRKESCHK